MEQLDPNSLLGDRPYSIKDIPVWETLWALDFVGDENGWARAEEVAALFNMRLRAAGMSVAGRFRYCRAYGLVVSKACIQIIEGREPSEKVCGAAYWRLTDFGYEAVHKKLSWPTIKALWERRQAELW